MNAYFQTIDDQRAERSAAFLAQREAQLEQELHQQFEDRYQERETELQARYETRYQAREAELQARPIRIDLQPIKILRPTQKTYALAS